MQTGGIAARIARAEKQAQQLSKLQIDYNRLRRARDHNEKLYTYLLERTKETDLQRMLRVNNIRVLDHPKLPEFPVKPRVPLMLLLGAFAGLGFGIAVAVGRNLLDRTIKIPDDIEDELGETCLGVLPNFEAPGSRDPKYGGKKRKRGREPDFKPELIVHTDPTSSVAEAARAIRTNLMFMSPDKPFSTILVTSAAPREGKTTVACSIAAAIAQVGLRVCLVDCDLRRPRIHKVFGMTADVGVTTALLGEVPVQDSIFETDADNLSVMPAGPIPPNPAELFHSEKFRSLLNKLQEDFDRVVIDSSPLLPVTDATVLSTLVDATVLVVRAAVTRREAATRAVRSLADVSSKTVGMVLNAFDFHRHDYKYSHYYGYGRYGYRPHARDQDASDSVRKDDAAQSSGQAARE